MSTTRRGFVGLLLGIPATLRALGKDEVITLGGPTGTVAHWDGEVAEPGMLLEHYLCSGEVINDTGTRSTGVR